MRATKRAGRIAATASIAAVAWGCGTIRFKDQPVVWDVDDRRDIAEPAEREYLRYAYFADVFALRRLERAMQLHDTEPAHDVNALEEVPNSTWFENRLSWLDLTPEQIATGPATEPGPEAPYVITKAKVGGGALGFIMKDAKDRSFLVKFDPPANPEMQTGTDVIVSRLFWAFGYHVPADYVFYPRLDDFEIDPKAKSKDDFGGDVPFTPDILRAALAAGAPPVNGAYRATASRFLDGKPKGGFSAEGVRTDDPNDTVLHEHRRELRGLRVLAAWLNHTDMKEDNTVDMYVSEGDRHYLRHYFVDFGEALGGHGAEKGRREDGYEHLFDWENQGKALLSLGLWERPWENLKPSPYASVGAFGMDRDWDPTDWREAYPYIPFGEMDATDAFWAAKIIMRFSRPALEAVVRKAELTEPGAAAFVVDALEDRKRRIGLAYLEALSPLEITRVGGGRVCVRDLGVHYGLAREGIVERLVDGDAVERSVVQPDATACVALPDGPEGAYRVLRLRVARGDREKPAMEIHLVVGDDPHVVGLVRDAG